MIPSLLAIALALATTYASLLRLRRVATALSTDPGELAKVLGRGADTRKLRGMARALRDEGASWEADLFDAALNKTERARTAEMNELLGDLASELAWGEALAATAAKISILGALAIVCAAAAGAHASAYGALEVLIWGAVGLVASLSAGGEAKGIAARLRADVDVLVERVLSAAEGGRAFETRGGVDSEPGGV